MCQCTCVQRYNDKFLVHAVLLIVGFTVVIVLLEDIELVKKFKCRTLIGIFLYTPIWTLVLRSQKRQEILYLDIASSNFF